MVDFRKVDSLRFVKENPQMFLSFPTATGPELCSKILIDALSNDVGRISIERRDDWWVVASDSNWIGENSAKVSISDLFDRIHANPKAGQNAMRNEILLAAFAAQIIVFERSEILVVRGGDETLAAWTRSREPSEYSFGVAFTVDKQQGAGRKQSTTEQGAG